MYSHFYFGQLSRVWDYGILGPLLMLLLTVQMRHLRFLSTSEMSFIESIPKPNNSAPVGLLRRESICVT